MDADGNNASKIIPVGSLYNAISPRLSPDGEKVVYTSNEATGAGIRLLDITSQESTLLKLNVGHPSYPEFSPDGKEICDLMIVFKNQMLIFSIKDIQYKGSNERYIKRAIENNLKQLMDAERNILLQKEIELDNPRRGKEVIQIKIINNVFRIAISMGDGDVSFSPLQKINSKPVHIFDRRFIEIILNELDTIGDFTDYLTEKERLVEQKISIMTPGEEEILAWYLTHDRKFDSIKQANFVTLEKGIWKQLTKNPRYIDRVKEDEASYAWDLIINRLHESGDPKYEKVARELAASNRFTRRVLSQAWLDMGFKKTKRGIQNRKIMELNGITYAFIFVDAEVKRKERQAFLSAISFIARGMIKKNQKIIGIATEKLYLKKNALDVLLLYLPEWLEKHQKEMEQLQKDTNIMRDATPTHHHVTEYYK